MRTRFLLILAFLGTFLLPHLLLAQTTLATGSIQGKITDPRGGALNAVQITFTSKATGAVRARSTNPSGLYTSGALMPGVYDIKMEAKGFQPEETEVKVEVGITRGLNVKMFVRAENRLPIPSSAVQIYGEQPTIQGVLTAEQLNGLPVNGRNFAVLATLEPGVQIQDGGVFDPTKNGFTSVSFGGHYGRTGRFSVDGVDVSDEEVGTTTQNIPLSAIREFNLQQSFLDPSTELTSSGTVNVVTRSGSNAYHGQAFYLFRDHRVAAALPGGNDNPFQRNQFGGAFGGALIKDKLFFFVAGERVKQDLTAPVLPTAPFSTLAGTYSSPFRENQGDARIDWLIKPDNYRFFYRFSYDGNRGTSAFLPNTFQPFTNVNSTPTQTVGLDFTTGAYTHSLRFGYMKFHNHLADAVTGSSVFNPAPGLELAIGSDPTCLTPSANQFCSGPSYLAPQVTIQSNTQIKWDAGRVYHGHLVRFGLGYNRVHDGGYASFLGVAPAVNAAAGTDPNPLNYLAQNVILGNGQGFSSELSAFGFPGGGQGPDNRLLAYIGDSWKLRHNITLNYALRYQRDTGRTDSDLAAISTLNQFGAGFGNRVRQPNKNFGPQLGIAWDPTGNGKTVVRAGIGLFYENNLWNNQLFDRPARLQTGRFGLTQQACIGGVPQTFFFPGSSIPVTPTFCGQPIGTVESQIALLQQQYQAATANNPVGANPAFIGNSLTSTINGTRTALFDPAYQTPRSTQINLGVQHELRPGTVVSIDYLRNVETHTLLGVDVNHVGDARFLNTQNALNAITATLAASAPTCLPAGGIVAGAVSQTAISCYLAQVPNASISDFAANGLDSGNALCGGAPCPNAAFQGVNPNLGANQVLFPSGRSVYTALQFKFNQNIARRGRMVSGIDLLVSYSLSKLDSTAQDSDFVNAATDNNQPTAFFGPNALDRKHQISFGGVFQLPFSLHLSLISHFYSPLPSNLLLPTTGKPGGIFVTDVTGDGSGDGSVVYPIGDPVPGTNLGEFGRTVKGSNINSTIQAYNAQLGATPAGAALIRAQIINLGQLSELKGVEQALAAAPSGQQGLSWLRSTDITLGWDYRVRERFVVTPNVSLFNIFNFANFDGANNPLSPILNTAGNSNPGSLNSTTYHQRSADRIGLGTGVFSLGSPRVIEFGVRVSF
jgi:hypothetical protein